MNAWIKKKTTKCIRTSLGRKVTKRQEKQIKLEALQLRLHSYMCTCRAFFFPATECSAFNAIYITPIHRAHSLFSRFISLKMFVFSHYLFFSRFMVYFLILWAVPLGRFTPEQIFYDIPQAISIGDPWKTRWRWWRWEHARDSSFKVEMRNCNNGMMLLLYERYALLFL